MSLRWPAYCMLAAFSWASVAHADNNLVLEVLSPGANSDVFSNYKGIDKDKIYINADLFWSAESDEALWQLEATDLGLDGRAVNFQWQSSNDVGFVASYKEVAQQGNSSGLTPYRGAENLVLPVSWVPGATTSGFDTSEMISGFDQDSLRRMLSISADKRYNRAFKLKAAVDFVERTGSRLTGAAIYSNAANPQAVLLPEPIDHSTLSADITAELDLGRLALTTSASMIQFRNDNDQLTWQNPFINGLGTRVDYPAGIGGLATEPEYDQYALSMSSSYRLRPDIQLVLTGAASRTEQDQTLADYSVNPLLSVVRQAPLSSLDGRLETSRLNFFVLTRPFARASLNFRYRFKARENTASRLAWNSVIGDATDQPDIRFSLFNRPLEKEVDIYALEGGYRLTGGQRIKVVYRMEDTYRNYASVKDTKLESWVMELRSPGTGEMQHRVSAQLDDHRGTTYEWSRSFFQTLTTSMINQTPDDQRWSNHPLLRQYHLANHEDVTIKWHTGWQPSPRWQLDLDARAKDVTFDKSELGLTDTRQQSVQLNVAYHNKNYQAWGWASFDQDQREQTGRDFSGGIQKPANRMTAPLPQGSDPARNYDIDQDTVAVTLGFGMSLQFSDQIKARYRVFRGFSQRRK